MVALSGNDRCRQWVVPPAVMLSVVLSRLTPLTAMTGLNTLNWPLVAAALLRYVLLEDINFTPGVVPDLYSVRAQDPPGAAPAATWNFNVINSPVPAGKDIFD